MRWLFGLVAALVVIAGIHLGLAASSLTRLAAAAQAGDGAAVLERTDLKSLNRSLTDQVVRAYLERIGQTRRISPMEKILVNTYGTSIADAMVAKMLTAERLTEMLKSGKMDGSAGLPSFRLPALGHLAQGNWLALLGRVRFIQPVLLAIRVSDSTDADDYAAIDLHAEGLDWKLAGIELPKAVVRELAASLPVR